MIDLPICRWRECRSNGTLRCHSEKFIAPPNTVTAGFCKNCYYQNHAPLSAANAPGPMVVDKLLPEGRPFAVENHYGAGLPPIFCITCSQTPERTAQAAEHFRARGLGVQFFPGIHGKTFGLRTVFSAWLNYRMTAGHIGLVLSHYMLWQTLAFLPHDEILILEDDAWFEPNFVESFRLAYAELPHDWQFVFVGGLGVGLLPAHRLTDRVSVVWYPCGTHAYLVKRSALALLLHTNHQARTHIDLQLIDNTLPWLKCYTFTPSLVKQRGLCSPSDGTGENWPSTTFVPDSDELAPIPMETSARCELWKYERRVHSQNDEDGIIAEILRRTRTTGLAVEVGAHCDYGNCYHLAEQGYPVLFIECNADSLSKLASRIHGPQVCYKLVRITAENADAVVPFDTAILSIDIDGNDYWVWKALKCRPAVVIIEFNLVHPPPDRKVIVYDPDHSWDATDYCGASLNALHDLGASKGYTLVGTDSIQCNAYFVLEKYADLFELTTPEQLWYPPTWGHPKSLRQMVDVADPKITQSRGVLPVDN